MLITVEDAAAIMRIGRSKAYELVTDGRMPGVVKLGDRSIRVHRQVLIEWLDDVARGLA